MMSHWIGAMMREGGLWQHGFIDGVVTRQGIGFDVLGARAVSNSEMESSKEGPTGPGTDLVS